MRFQDALEKRALARVRDERFWRALSGEDRDVPDDEGSYRTHARPLEDGVAFAPALLTREEVAPARRAVYGVLASGYPAVFAVLTDAFVELLANPALRGLVGERAQLPGVYVHLVERARGARGWEPHVDVAEPRARDTLTVWIALSDAPLDGGCLYVVPRSKTEGLSESWTARRTASMSELLSLCHHAMAAPVRSGGAVCWHRGAVHWAAPVERAHRSPRLAISLEYAARAGPDERPFDPSRGLTFDERLFLLGNALLAYGDPEREPAAAEWAWLGDALVTGGGRR